MNVSKRLRWNALHKFRVVLAAAGLSLAAGYHTALGQTPTGTAPRSDHLIICVGAGGEEEYAIQFKSSADKWATLAEANGWTLRRIDSGTVTEPQKVLLQTAIEAVDGDNASTQRVWLVLIGHGTASAGVSKFNLIGDDVSSVELRSWIRRVECPLVVIQCASASGGFLPELSDRDDVVITATRSPAEINFSRFGGYLADSITSAEADLDHDDEVSLLEAFLKATADTGKFYRDASRLATENALIDDNGDNLGTGGEFYVGARRAGMSKTGQEIDGKRAARIIVSSLPNAIQLSPELAAEREQIEASIDALRARRENMDSNAFYDAIEPLLSRMALLYKQAQ